MADAPVPSLFTDDGDTTFDHLVCQVSARLEEGQEIEWEILRRTHPEYVEKLLGLLPTLQAMALLRHGTSAAVDPLSTDGSATTPKVLGDFHVLKEIGRGGMGVVYEAEQI